MIDKEKVINDLQDAVNDDWMWRHADYYALTMERAIALLKEQEAVEPFHRCIGKEFTLIEDSHFDYCPFCGKPITWTKQEGR